MAIETPPKPERKDLLHKVFGDNPKEDFKTELKRQGKRRLKAVGAVAVAGLALLGANKLAGGDTAEAGRQRPTPIERTASPTPAETVVDTTTPVEQLVGASLDEWVDYYEHNLKAFFAATGDEEKQLHILSYVSMNPTVEELKSWQELPVANYWQNLQLSCAFKYADDVKHNETVVTCHYNNGIEEFFVEELILERKTVDLNTGKEVLLVNLQAKDTTAAQ